MRIGEHIITAGAQAATAATAGAAGIVQATTSPDAALPLYILSGVCAIMGSIGYGVKEEEGGVKDLLVNGVLAFIIGMPGGALIGVYALDRMQIGGRELMPDFGPYMIGGALIGAFVIPLLRLGWRQVAAAGRVAGAIGEWLKKFGGGK